MNFEEMMKELEEIVNRLENEDLPLEESIKLFERGVELYRKCKEILQQNRLKIIDVMKELEGEIDASGRDQENELR
ncbi:MULTISPECIES: exodeoxyribonuclease VII small subunit [Thermotoga]|uniref:Exodeoxyribonuclease 7 small subunit n=2 Tax=Thermotoga TaxID=2335 RepID=EX7S_THEMA|nr:MULTISPECIES: exodeoxyribonuclease VII small subunit [Thermotoga]A5ILK1.1 RecName: Full=Exodeoxyribonuclease 7 small subunit; AltName: Full=Exodeoxyribonuclease VII small subunit; Short=Exonuclease VII small subunit [Thermotoga petrophila RKU-1]Q9X290.2 RecName: Full=Exodeoxyribonuclease 7 small subunit; AltName: Full=Exodeoxyribonuclease VII small subunit; Short=Exonuclease VII small subunit [Thermotoga maritima MSB8]MBZ4662053.1 Exodeoxyribonuclease small subunit [Thermotoga sp.]ABQ47074.1